MWISAFEHGLHKTLIILPSGVTGFKKDSIKMLDSNTH